MLKRYTTDKHGKKELLAKIYTSQEHKIQKAQIDPDAVRICARLRREGHEAYIVGGAVRDLLVGKHPKDFDIATDALPKTIRKLFWNSRIIGKRFKLVHIHFKEKIFEVSTFRSANGEENIFGEISEDVNRRDYTINALYYCPHSQQILDFVDGFKDIKDKKVRSLLPLATSFKEDPVRIIRGLKYAAITGFSMDKALMKAMKNDARCIAECSASRLTEELFKIISCGYTEVICREAERVNVMPFFLPQFSDFFKSKDTKKNFYKSVSILDRRLLSGEKLERGHMFFYLLSPLIKTEPNEDMDLLFLDIFNACKKILHPLTPPNVDIELASREIMITLGISVPHEKRLSAQKSKRKALQKAAGPAHHKKYHRSRHRSTSR